MKRFSWLLACVVLACTPEVSKPARFVARHDALSSGVVISEVYGGAAGTGATYRHDFVELFNRGTAPVDVSGWSVQYTSDTGGSWQPTSLATFAGPLQPGQYLLVRMATGSTGAALPAHDVSGATAMSGTAGKVALVNSMTGLNGTCPSSASIVDLVGYGTAANCSEGGPTANTSPTTSVSRIGNGCTETDSNGNDFIVSGPTPQGSSVIVPCGTQPPVDAGTPGDGGTTPVDAGVVTLPDAGCTVITNWPSGVIRGGYVAADETAFGEREAVQADGGTDVLTLEAYFGGGLTLAAMRTFNSSTRYANCELCALMSTGCDSAGTCAKDFFGQAGSAIVTTATQNEATGQFVGSISSVRFVEWDFVNDQRVTGGECIDVVSTTIDVFWDPPIGGGGGGSTGGGGGAVTGGGSGGGSGGGATGGGSGGGTMEADAGTGGGGGKLGGSSGCGCTSGGEGSLALLVLGALARRRRRSAR
ncbi:MAG: lamin tail domain-containing protein [Archangium sp.]|nr:lamin tail domain-containing protein [Archangium sp.]